MSVAFEEMTHQGFFVRWSAPAGREYQAPCAQCPCLAY